MVIASENVAAIKWNVCNKLSVLVCKSSYYSTFLQILGIVRFYFYLSAGLLIIGHYGLIFLFFDY